ncbi:MAG TPA: hypothetical protein VGL53_04975 [Bryobacteraceae bacterium]|jgi:hypothetical protein
MKPMITRRTGFATLLAASLLDAEPSATPPPAVADNFPSQPAELVRETVLVAHGNVKRLRELVDAHPDLAKAAIDWGFGDWEDALGAASHVGNREIAEHLIAHGARPTLYSATMFGQLDVVKAFVAAQPGCQKIPGPHSISLLAHAKNGGPAAEPVFRYLESLGDAGAPPAAPITVEELTALAGTYSFGTAPRNTIEITLAKTQLMFTRPGSMARGLVHLGNHTFHPAGAPAVRIGFAIEKSVATLTVHDPDPILIAKRG